ncbi:MAG: hypothetical protein Q4C70_04525 [Planctomycetia bacterium]|nr:hypothetical protein [Planctomycetia bacterium]
MPSFPEIAWSDVDFPGTAQWLDQNETVMEILAEAVRKPYFLPHLEVDENQYPRPFSTEIQQSFSHALDYEDWSLAP